MPLLENISSMSFKGIYSGYIQFDAFIKDVL
jgi:hypothetical protein